MQYWLATDGHLRVTISTYLYPIVIPQLFYPFRDDIRLIAVRYCLPLLPTYNTLLSGSLYHYNNPMPGFYAATLVPRHPFILLIAVRYSNF